MSRFLLSAFFYLVLSNIIFQPQIFKTQTKWLTDLKGKKIHIDEVKEWNAHGDIVKWIEYVDGNKPFMRTFSYEYNAGHKVKMVDLGNSAFTIYMYDKSGRLTQEMDYSKTKKLLQKSVNVYQGNSKNIGYIDVYDEKGGIPFMRTTFEYYANGLKKKEVQTAGGAWNQTNEYKYDNNRNLIYESAIVDGGVGLVKYYYTYKKNTLVKDIIQVPDTGIEYHIYETKLNDK